MKELCHVLFHQMAGKINFCCWWFFGDLVKYALFSGVVKMTMKMTMSTRMSGLSEANPSIEQLSFANKQLRSATELQTNDDDLEIVQMESIWDNLTSAIFSR